MAGRIRQLSRAWELAARQHGVVSRKQLLELGFTRHAIQHRFERGRLHSAMTGVYAVGRRQLSRKGRWMAAVLCCGDQAMLSHRSAAALWGFAAEEGTETDVSIPVDSHLRRPGIRLHRRLSLPREDVVVHDAIPATGVVRTLLDIATVLEPGRLERAVNEADRLDLIDPGRLRTLLGAYGGQRGVVPLRTLLDRRTFRTTDSDLERSFLRIVDSAGLLRPHSGVHLNGFRVDFYWPDLGLVVECDGLRYHRTPSQQARDQLRDQAHTAAGLVPLRFSHAQVRFEPEHVRRTLQAVIRRLRGPSD